MLTNSGASFDQSINSDVSKLIADSLFSGAMYLSKKALFFNKKNDACSLFSIDGFCCLIISNKDSGAEKTLETLLACFLSSDKANEIVFIIEQFLFRKTYAHS